MKASIILSVVLAFVLTIGFAASADTGEVTLSPVDNGAETYDDGLSDDQASDDDADKKKKKGKKGKKKGKKGKKGKGKKAKKEADLE